MKLSEVSISLRRREKKLEVKSGRLSRPRPRI